MIHIVINPAAGQTTPVLAILNSVFHPAGIPWRVSITQKEGDAKIQAEEAAADGVDIVAAYGGDGTVAEVASGLLGSDIPLAILPGGTANVVAQELGIPQNLYMAAQVAINKHSHKKQIDIAQVNNVYFLLRVGLGTEAKITQGADRELKNRLGFLAYVWSAAQSLASVEMATYHLTIDGEKFHADGVTCSIMNTGNMGLGGLQLSSDIRIDDGLLDVVVLKTPNLPTLTDLVSGVTGLAAGTLAGQGQINLETNSILDLNSYLSYWRAKEVTAYATPQQVIQYDGELLQADKVHCRVLPAALRVIVPHKPVS
ncbi:MAG: diacylglycerol kinase family protein [Chloroflexota bacterium]